ncbi:DNA repair protein SWI5 homolog [Gavia stellata]|nr:DNA repair protein SWI5 homolog [Gavia stellata]
MSAPRPGHVSRGGEGGGGRQAPPRPGLRPTGAARPFAEPRGRSSQYSSASLRTGKFVLQRRPPRRAREPRPGPVRGKLPAPACPAAAARLQLPACPAAQSAPVRREAAALAEGVPPTAGRSPPRHSPAPPRPLSRRTPGGGRRSGTAGFKSPIPSPRSCQPNGANEEALRYEIEELKQKDLALDQEIAQLLSEGYSLEELEKHISLLHEYNDIKDAGQMLLGKLAVIRGVTTKQLYPEYDLELSD